MRLNAIGGFLVSVLLVAAAGCAKKPNNDLPPPPGWGEEEEDEYNEVDQPNVDSYGYDDTSDEHPERAGDSTSPPGEPQFTPGMSVDDAIAAASGTERLNIDPEALGAPLTDPKLYEPCKLKPSDHFDLRVAVWNGRAVGIDLDTKNEALKQCLTQQLLQLKWPDKVKSLNTVEYSM